MKTPDGLRRNHRVTQADRVAGQPQRRGTVIFVRHGQSVANEMGYVAGSLPMPQLTDLGRAQARQAAHSIACEMSSKPVALWCSDSRRTLATADVIGQVLGCRPRVVPALREQFLGQMQGCLSDQLAALEPTEPGAGDGHIADQRWFGGESLADVYRRSTSWLSHQLTEPVTNVVVSHQHTIVMMEAWLAGRSHRDGDFAAALPPGGVRVSQTNSLDQPGIN